jgi:hypothetical protein
MGRVKRGTSCSINSCEEEAVRSVSTHKAKAAGLDVDGRRAYLCKAHYRDYKRGSREERRIMRWRHGAP